MPPSPPEPVDPATLGALCERLELDGKSGALAEVGPLLASIGLEVGRVRVRLEAEVRSAA